MIDFFANIFGYVLKLFNHIFGNFGAAIIAFTLFTKLVLLPLVIKQQKATKKMAKIQPKLNELQNKYKDKTDMESKQQYAMEFEKLQKEENFNPMTGCLLALVQIPIILAMFYIVRSPLTYMMKMDKADIDALENSSIVENVVIIDNGEGEDVAQESEIIEETSKQQDFYREITIIKNHPELGINLNWLGLNLGDRPSENKENWTLIIIPVLSVIITSLSIYVTTKMNNDMNKNNPQYLETQKSMSTMNYMLPIMSGLIAYRCPLGLGLYWLTNNILQTIQFFILSRVFKDKEETVLLPKEDTDNGDRG